MTRADEPVGAGRPVMLESPGLVIDDEYPLSPLQQGMLFHSLDRNQRGVDLEQVLCTLTEPLDVPQLLAAWDAVVVAIRRPAHELPVGGGASIRFRHVHRAVELPVRRHRLAAVAAGRAARRLASLMAVDRASGFDLNARAADAADDRVCVDRRTTKCSGRSTTRSSTGDRFRSCCVRCSACTTPGSERARLTPAGAASVPRLHRLADDREIPMRQRRFWRAPRGAVHADAAADVGAAGPRGRASAPSN